MIEFVATSIFDSKAQTITNPVNTDGIMGKGLSKEFKEKYPDNFEAYKNLCKNGSFKIGNLLLFPTADKWILNFPTKQHWRYPSRLEYIEAGLSKFVSIYEQEGITSISFPELGCGNGNLAWYDVKKLMEKYLSELSIPVYVHTSHGYARI